MRDKVCLIKVDEISIGYKKVKKKAIVRVHVITVALMERVHMEGWRTTTKKARVNFNR